MQPSFRSTLSHWRPRASPRRRPVYTTSRIHANRWWLLRLRQGKEGAHGFRRWGDGLRAAVGGRRDLGDGVAGDQLHVKGVGHGAGEDVVDHADGGNAQALRGEPGLKGADVGRPQTGQLQLPDVGLEVLLDDVGVALTGLEPAIWGDVVGHPPVQPVTDEQPADGQVHALVQGAEELSKSTLCDGLGALDGLVPTASLPHGVAAKVDGELPGAGAALSEGAFHWFAILLKIAPK